MTRSNSAFIFSNFLTVFLIGIFQISGCNSLQHAQPNILTVENIQFNNSQAETNQKPNKVINADLEKNKKLWKEKNITDYDLTASLFKGGTYRWLEPVLIKVRNGQEISTESLDEKFKGYPIEEIEKAMEGYKELNTIEKMFDYIQKGLDEEAEVSVKYDKNFGYPKDMRVNFYRRGSDNWQTMIIRKFEIIK